jgi:hypothetical protein
MKSPFCAENGRSLVFTAFAAFLLISSCSSQTAAKGSGGFGMLASPRSNSAAAKEGSIHLTSLKFSDSSVIGGGSSEIVLSLSQPAPAGNIQVALNTSQPKVVQLPQSVEFPEGQESLNIPVFTDAVSAAVSVTVRAELGDSIAGANLSVLPAASAPVTGMAAASVAVQRGTTNPDATFKGCWYKQGDDRYQAVDVKVGKPGSYSFNAVLYYGSTCDAKDVADQFGFGQLLNLGSAEYTFWFTAFANRTDMSALWYLGDKHSKCVNYASAPDC